MIFKELTVENFGEIDFFETSFDSKLTVLSEKYADDIIKAIGLVTNNKTLFETSEKQILSEATRISAVLKMQCGTFRLNFTGVPPNGRREAFALNGNKSVDFAELLKDICLCKEEENLTYYRFDCANMYAERLFRYKDPEKYYLPGEFLKRTDGVGTTKSFRACLAQYIKEYNTKQVFSSDKVRLLSDGRFVTCNAESHEKTLESDNRLFDYFCYLKVKEFWERFENIRNMNCENWPSIVDTAGLFSVSEYKKLLFQSECIKRQFIIKG